jgi:hypothetical protein
MAKGKLGGTTGNKGLIWGAWLLSTCGFGILLGGVAAMQNVGGSPGDWGWCVWGWGWGGGRGGGGGTGTRQDRSCLAALLLCPQCSGPTTLTKA